MKVVTSEQFNELSFSGKSQYLKKIEKFARPVEKLMRAEHREITNINIAEVVDEHYKNLYKELLDTLITDESVNYYFKKTYFRFTSDGEFRLWSFIENNVKSNLEWNV